jgi:hypothetical protein
MDFLLLLPSCATSTSGFAKWRHYLALKNFAIFAALARVDNVLESSNYGNMPLRWLQCSVQVGVNG